MTVTYTAKVATSSMGCFLKLLFRWRGSVYKLVWREFFIFVLLYYTLSFVYRFALVGMGKRGFEQVARYCKLFNDLIPLAFVLGFYVSVVLSRWWEQFNKIPWPDRMALFVTASIQGDDERGRLMRRTIMRYLCLSFVITLSSISPPVKKRFPNFGLMTDAGFMQTSEQKIMESVQTPHNKYFIPLVWSTSLVTRARKEGRIKDDYAVKTLIDEINAFRGQLGGLFNYDWISLPLVYTQVVTLSTYTFFLSCLMGRQFLKDKKQDVADVYVPVFTFLQFLFYMGWLKVAETLVNPFGEDDDDFDINQVIDRNLQVSYLVVDEMHQEHPDLIKDAYWDDIEFELPYTEAAEQFRTNSPFIGSAMDINISPKQTFFVAPSLGSIPEHMHDASQAEEARAEPTDIPIDFEGKHYRNHRHVPPSSSKQRLLNRFLRRSTSRRSSQNADTDSALGSTMRLKREESVTSKGSEDRPASPTITSTQGDIFNMEDLSDEDPELNFISDSANTQSTGLLDTWRSKHATGKDSSGPSSPDNSQRRDHTGGEERHPGKMASLDEDLPQRSVKVPHKKRTVDLPLLDTKIGKAKGVSLPTTPLVQESVPVAQGNTLSMLNMTIVKEDRTPEYLRTHSLSDTKHHKTLAEQV